MFWFAGIDLKMCIEPMQHYLIMCIHRHRFLNWAYGSDSRAKHLGFQAIRRRWPRLFVLALQVVIGSVVPRRL